MIFKIQRSLFSSDGVIQLLIYNKDRSIQGEFELEQNAPILDMLKDRPRIFVEGALSRDGQLHISHEVEDPGW